MSSGIYSENGILTFIGMNFYLVSDAWSKVAGFIATSFSIFWVSLILPNPINTRMKGTGNRLFVSCFDICDTDKLDNEISFQINQIY